VRITRQDVEQRLCNCLIACGQRTEGRYGAGSNARVGMVQRFEQGSTNIRFSSEIEHPERTHSGTLYLNRRIAERSQESVSQLSVSRAGEIPQQFNNAAARMNIAML
jgi:hypothetical protein